VIEIAAMVKYRRALNPMIEVDVTAADVAKVLPAEEFEPRPREDQQDERNLFDRVKDMFG